MTVSHLTLSQSALERQPWPAVHFGAIEPPQSGPVSSPFFTPSVGEGAWQMPPVQTPLVQSAAIDAALVVLARRRLRAAAVDVGLVAVLHAVGGADRPSTSRHGTEPTRSRARPAQLPPAVHGVVRRLHAGRRTGVAGCSAVIASAPVVCRRDRIGPGRAARDECHEGEQGRRRYGERSTYVETPGQHDNAGA